MPRLGHGSYPLGACVQFYVKYWEDRARGKQNTKAREDRDDLQTQILRAKLEEQTGHLINRVEVFQVWTSCFMRLGKTLDGLPALMGRRHSLSSEVMRSMRAELDEMRENFVRDSREFIDVVEAPDVKASGRRSR